MKRLISLFLLATLLLLPTADANRTIYKNRLMPPHILESVLTYPDIQTFTSTGTWYRPPGVEHVWVICSGGGGGGGGHQVATQNSAGGGQGGQCVNQIVDIRGTSSETVTIGAAGAGGLAHADGSAGGTSSFGAIVTAVGGAGGDTAGQETIGDATDYGAGIGASSTQNGSAGAYGVGGTGDAGGGGGGSYGAGAAGGAADTNGSAAAVNTGGGGGGAGNDAGTPTVGGDGGTGICTVISLPRSYTLP